MKYFIYSNPRCASTMLSDALGCNGEVFGRDSIQNRYSNALVNHGGVWVINRNIDLSSMLDEFENFKLIHLQVSNDHPLYDQILDRGFKCVSLRRNLWRCCVSFKLAKESGVWHVDKPYRDRQIFFPIDEVEWFLRLYSTKDEVESRFEDVLRIEYDDVISNWDCVSKEISTYLNCRPPKMTHCKRTIKNPESLILNYEEIYLHFQGTKFESLFPKPLMI